MRNVVQQVSFAFHQLLQLRRHFVELHAQIGQFVFTVVQLLRYARIQFAGSQPVHAEFQNADGFGDVAGQNIGQNQPDHECGGKNNQLMPHGFQRQAGDDEAGQAFDLIAVEIADEEEIFFAERVVIQHAQIGIWMLDGVFVGVVDFFFGNAAVEQIEFVVALDD